MSADDRPGSRPVRAGAPASANPVPPNYAARRAGALVVVLLIVFGLVRLVGTFVGGDDEMADQADAAAQASIDQTTASDDILDDPALDGDDTASDRTDIDCSDGVSDDLCASLGLSSDAVVVDADPADTVLEGEDANGDVETAVSGPPEAEAEAETETENTGPPTSNNRASVYIVGDSDAGTFGPYLQTLLAGTLVTDTQLNYKVSSGLARPDFFDWPTELAKKLPEVDPDIVVATFGGNDAQGLTVPELTAAGQPDFIIGDPVANEAEWLAEYQRRAGEVMDLLLEDDRAVIWVGIPNDDSADVTARLEVQDRAAKAAAAERPGIVFVDTWGRFSGRDGGWAEFVIDPRDGVGKDVRADDGFHLNQNGAEILAIDIAVAVQEELRAMGAAL